MHFINDCICYTLQLRSSIIFPARGIRFTHVEDSSTMTIDANSFCKDAGIFGHPVTILFDAKGVETSFQVFFDDGFPKSFRLALHLQSLEGGATFTFRIDSQDYTIGIRTPKFEGAFISRIGKFVDFFHRYRIIIY